MGILSVVLPFFSLLTALILGFVVLRKNPRSITHRIFSMLSFLIAFWILCVFMADASKEMAEALFWSKIAMVGPALIPPLFLWFSLVFPVQKTKLQKRKISLMFLPAIFILILIPTSLNVKAVRITDWGTDFVPGPLYFILLGVLIVCMGRGFFNLISSLKRTSGAERAQVKYLLLGALATLVFALIANLVLPYLGYGKASVFGPSFSLVFIGSIAYAITRYRFMDVRLTIGRGAVYLLSFSMVVLFSFVAMVLNETILQPSLPYSILGPLTAILSLFLFRFFFGFYQTLAAKYFYYPFYSYQTVLGELGKELTRVLDLDKLVSLLTTTLIETMKLDRTVILLRDSKTGKYQIKQNIGFKEENGISLVKDDFLTAYLENSQSPLVYEELSLVIRDAQNEEQKKKLQTLSANMERIEAAVCLPLLLEKKINGMIILGNKISGDPYSKEDLELLTNLANQASIALQNARLYSQVEDLSENLQQKVDEQTKELRAAYEELKKIDKAKSEFISMASHQLRTPLSAIKGYVSMLIEGSYGELPQKTKEKLQNVFSSNERLIHIVNDLLSISKIEMGKMELDKKPAQIEDLIGSVYQEMKPLAQEKNLELSWLKPKTCLPKIMIDELKIRQAVYNLVDNSIKYTQKGTVEIRAKRVGSSIQIMVKDTGEGLTKEEQETIFDWFFKRGTAGVDLFIEGSGLGLYVAKKYLGLHHGKIWAESKGKGQGSTFYISLPVIDNRG